MKQLTLLILMTVTLPSQLSASFPGNQFVTKDHFSINLPFQWAEIPSAELRQYSPKAGYNYGYQETPHSGWFRGSPYIVIKVIPDDRLNEFELKNTDKITESIYQGVQNSIYLRDLPFKDHEVVDVIYDDEKNILYSTIILTNISGHEYYMGKASFLTNDGHIDMYLHFDDSNDYGTYMDLFDQIAENVNIDETMVYTPSFLDRFPFIASMKSSISFIKTKKFALLAMIFCLLLWRAGQRKFKR